MSMGYAGGGLGGDGSVGGLSAGRAVGEKGGKHALRNAVSAARTPGSRGSRGPVCR